MPAACKAVPRRGVDTLHVLKSIRVIVVGSKVMLLNSSRAIGWGLAVNVHIRGARDEPLEGKILSGKLSILPRTRKTFCITSHLKTINDMQTDNITYIN